MTEKLDFSFQVFQTAFHVVYDDITQLDADIIVSTDDTFFSGSSGISKKIQKIIGKSTVKKEVSKHKLPVPISKVMITDAGPLPAKYVAHVAVLDLAHHLNPRHVIPKITGRVIDIANALDVQKVITPILIEKSTDSSGNHQTALSQLTGQSIANVLDIVLRSLAYHIVNKNDSISLRNVTIAMYQDGADDHTITEQQVLANLAPVHQKIIEWTTTLKAVNEWMVHIQPLLAHLGDTDTDKELRTLLVARFQGGRDTINTVFGFSELDQQAEGLPANLEEYEALPLDQEEFQHRQQRLSSIQSNLEEEIASVKNQIKETRRRLYKLQESLAEIGEADAPPHLKLEVEDTEQEVDQLDSKREDLERQQTEIDQRLATLGSRWNAQQEAAVESQQE